MKYHKRNLCIFCILPLLNNAQQQQFYSFSIMITWFRKVHTSIISVPPLWWFDPCSLIFFSPVFFSNIVLSLISHTLLLVIFDIFPFHNRASISVNGCQEWRIINARIISLFIQFVYCIFGYKLELELQLWNNFSNVCSVIHDIILSVIFTKFLWFQYVPCTVYITERYTVLGLKWRILKLQKIKTQKMKLMKNVNFSSSENSSKI